MLYETHRKTGIAFTVASVPALQLTGFYPTYVSNVESAVLVAIGFLIALHGGQWGARYPDFDQTHSKAATKDISGWVISRIMHLFGVVHRGKFTHSLDSITLTFAVLFIGIHTGLPNLISGWVEHNHLNSDVITFLSLFYKGHILNILSTLWVLSAYVGAFSHLFADSSTNEGVRITILQKHNMAWVPSRLSILGWRPFKSVFNAGTELWENNVYAKAIWVVTGLAFVVSAIMVFFGTNTLLALFNSARDYSSAMNF